MIYKPKLWWSQTSINIGSDREALALAYKAGCRGMLIGFEAETVEKLNALGKRFVADGFLKQMERVANFHAEGLAVFGSFMVGGDLDTIDTVSEVMAYANTLEIDMLQLTRLTPLPGTQLYEDMLQEGRLLNTNYPEDWGRYDFLNTHMVPNSMSLEELELSFYELLWETANDRAWPSRVASRTLDRTGSESTALFVKEMDKGIRALALQYIQNNPKPVGFDPLDVNVRRSRIRDVLLIGD